MEHGAWHGASTRGQRTTTDERTHVAQPCSTQYSTATRYASTCNESSYVTLHGAVPVSPPHTPRMLDPTRAWYLSLYGCVLLPTHVSYPTRVSRHLACDDGDHLRRTHGHGHGHGDGLYTRITEAPPAMVPATRYAARAHAPATALCHAPKLSLNRSSASASRLITFFTSGRMLLD